MTCGTGLHGLWLPQWGRRVHSSCGHIRAGRRPGKYGPRGGGPVPFLERSQHSAALQAWPDGLWLVLPHTGLSPRPHLPQHPPSFLPCLPSFNTPVSIFFKLKLSTLTPKIIWHFYWDHTESVGVLRELGVCPTHSHIHSLKPLSACPTSAPPASPSSSPSSPPRLQAGQWGDWFSSLSEVGLVKDLLPG